MDDIPIYPFTLEELEKFPNAGDDIFFRRAIEMIDIGFNAGMDKITLFKIIEEESVLFLNLPATSWVGTLKDSITYFESTEEYEECAYAKIVLERIT
jgi:hypothetical protein